MTLAQGYPNSFGPNQQTQEVLHNLDNETKKIYTDVNGLMASNGHAHTGNGSDGAIIGIEGGGTGANTAAGARTALGLDGTQNKIINGNFSINQRAVTGTVTLSAGQYGHDRWKAGSSGCTYTFATVNNVTTITIAAGSLLQIIEGLNLFTGTNILSWQGTAQGRIGAGAYGASGITGAVTGGANLNIEFGTGTLKLAQFEQGSVATPFESRHIAQELMLCQRYYSRELINEWGMVGSTTDTNRWVSYKFPVTMIAVPTISTVATPQGFNLYSCSTNRAILLCNPGDTLQSRMLSQVISNAEL